MTKTPISEYANLANYRILSIYGEKIYLEHPNMPIHETSKSKLEEEIEFLRTLHMNMKSAIEQREQIIAQIKN